MFDKLIALFTNPIVDFYEFKRACKYAEENCDVNKDGGISLWELILLIFDYVKR
jgi:hypothetical protein